MNYDEALSSAEKTGTERRKKRRPAYRWVTWSIGAAVLIALLIWLPSGPLQTYRVYKNRPKPAVVERATRPSVLECTGSKPCTLEVEVSGSTKTVYVPGGQNPCFDPSFWSNLPRLGFTTSYRGRPEVRLRCTREEVASNICNAGTYDAFRFVPEAGVRLPDYWFVPVGTPMC